MRVRLRSAFLPLAAGLLLAWACAAQAQGLFDDNEARRRIDVLRQQLDTNQKILDERLAKVEASAADRGAILELSRQIDALRGEIAGMRGQVEVLLNQAETGEKRQKDLYLDIDTRLRKLEQGREQAAAPADKPGEPSTDEAKAFEAALVPFKLGNWNAALTAMQNFIVAYPTSALTPKAQYFVGMAHSGQRDYKSAIVAQRKLLTTWPDSPVAPDAMLGIASAYEAMGDRRSAQKSLEELVA